MKKYQDLRRFSLPDEARGRSRLYVQFWNLVQATLWAWSPKVLYGWRRFLLRKFGARVGEGVLIRQTARVTYPWNVSIGDHSWVGDDCAIYALGPISIGANVSIAHDVYFCAGLHDFESPDFAQLSRPIVIGDECWIANDVFVGPGVTIGRGSVVGARSSVFADLPEGMVCKGNPARPVRERKTIV